MVNTSVTEKGFDHNNGMPFSTHDRDRHLSNINCANVHGGGGGWWNMQCSWVKLTANRTTSETLNFQQMSYKNGGDWIMLSSSEIKMIRVA